MKLKILIADDDPEYFGKVNVRLRAAGYDTLLAWDAVAALNMAVHDKLALILLELHLPGGGGMMVLDSLRTLAPEIPVIVLTTREPLLYKDAALAAGACQYLHKPTDDARLLEVIRHVLPTEHLSDALGPLARIEIVEGDPRCWHDLSLCLRTAGYETLYAKDAIAAVSMAHRQKPDLILLELQLPGGGGMVVLDRLRLTNPEIPILMLSEPDDIGHKREALAAGAVDFLQEPVEARTLLSAVRNALRLSLATSVA